MSTTDHGDRASISVAIPCGESADHEPHSYLCPTCGNVLHPCRGRSSRLSAEQRAIRQVATIRLILATGEDDESVVRQVRNLLEPQLAGPSS